MNGIDWLSFAFGFTAGALAIMTGLIALAWRSWKASKRASKSAGPGLH